MDEKAARDLVLVRAIELTDHERQILSDDDRKYASRSANELAQWEAADKKSAVTPDLFLQKRAEQILKKLVERTPSLSGFVARKNWLRVAGIALPVLAFLLGAAADRIADPHRVDLLSAPLLLLIFWNLLVYAGLLLRAVVARPAKRRAAGGLFARLADRRMPVPRKLPQTLAAALARFSQEWAELSAPLAAARLKRIIHFSAACFAFGAIVSLYLRGILSQYRAGWESTFLDAEQVHAILSVLFMPAISVFHLQGFSIADIKALEFTQLSMQPSTQPGTQPGSLAGGALWVHLYAGTLFLFIIVPRLLLAAAARWKEYRLAHHFPLDLGHPYFRKLSGTIGPAPAAVLRVFPYSFTVDETRDRNLTTVAKLLLGEQARVMLRPSTAYGEEPQDALKDSTRDNADIALTVALFNLSATPEKENHGAFLDHLLRGSARRFLVLIDESAYLERVGADAAGNSRVRERIALWRQFCELHNVPAMIVNLLDPQARMEDIERGLATIARMQ